jgi:hypothetical protein
LDECADNINRARRAPEELAGKMVQAPERRSNGRSLIRRAPAHQILHPITYKNRRAPVYRTARSTGFLSKHSNIGLPSVQMYWMSFLYGFRVLVRTCERDYRKSNAPASGWRVI